MKSKMKKSTMLSILFLIIVLGMTIIFSDQNKVYSYRPFGKLLEGTYAKTGDPNVYILNRS